MAELSEKDALIEELKTVVEKQAKKIVDLEKQLKIETSTREKIIERCKKSGKGLYCLDSFRNNKHKYSPGDKVNPDNLINVKVKDLVKAELVIEVK